MRGQCTAKGGGCVVGADVDCKLSTLCEDCGRCVAKKGECVAAGDADCEKSTECEGMGRCVAKNGKCVVTAATCKKGDFCSTNGLCTAKRRQLWLDAYVDHEGLLSMGFAAKSRVFLRVMI